MPWPRGCAALLICFCALQSAHASVPGLQALNASGRFTSAVGPVLLSNASSSELVIRTGVMTRLECLAACQLSGCQLASLAPGSQTCRLLLLIDASRGPGPAGTHVQRLEGSEPGAGLWKAEHFEHLLIMRQLNITLVIANSGTGRTGSIQSVTIPSTGCYRIEVSGARGGSNLFSGKAGGSGAVVSGAFGLATGTALTVVVGQAGGPSMNLYSGGGGGGGSFVYRTADAFLLAAAGGGGAGTYAAAGLPGEAGANGTDTHPYGDPVSYGGINGQPGFNDPSVMPSNQNHGGCGAGWLGKPVNARRGPNDGDGGGGRVEGWVGGAAGGANTGVGGFGGGGGGGVTSPNWGASGAGGGFSGGGTGSLTSPPAGGGGSFCGGGGCSGATGGNAAQHGLVVIRLLKPFVDRCE